MSAEAIRSKIQAGLARANTATGSSTSEKIYLIQKSYGSGRSPINTADPIETVTLLPNALVKSYTSQEIDNSDVRQGDKQLVSDHTVAIKEGDTVRQGVTDYDVVAVDTKAPTSDVLVYISQIREK